MPQFGRRDPMLAVPKNQSAWAWHKNKSRHRMLKSVAQM
jgi:hypothetical protein